MQYTTFVTMKKIYIILILSGILCSYGIYAQQSRYYQRITRIVTDAGDTATMIILRPVYIFPKRTFKSQKEKEYYCTDKMVVICDRIFITILRVRYYDNR